MERTTEHDFVALILILAGLIIGGYMDAQDNEIIERIPAQVAQK